MSRVCGRKEDGAFTELEKVITVSVWAQGRELGRQSGAGGARPRSHAEFYHKDVGLQGFLMSWRSIYCFALAVFLAFQDRIGARGWADTRIQILRQNSLPGHPDVCVTGGVRTILAGRFSIFIRGPPLSLRKLWKRKITYFHWILLIFWCLSPDYFFFFFSNSSFVKRGNTEIAIQLQQLGRKA